MSRHTPVSGFKLASAALVGLSLPTAALAFGQAGDEAAAGQANPSSWPRLVDPVPADPAMEARIRTLLDRMSIEQKVGQIIQADLGSVTPDDVTRYHLGSILNGGNSKPGGKLVARPEEWLAAADRFYLASMKKKGRLPVIPLIWGSDAVHGHNNIPGATLFPHNIGLGAARDPELMRRIGRITAIEMRVTGLDWTFAPTLAVPRDDRWGRTYEGFSEDPAIVASYARPLVEGLQGKIGDPDWLKGPHIIATAKHFVGDGATDKGRDQGDASISETELRDVQAAGYPPAMEAGVQSVMASFSSWQGVKMHGNRSLLTDVLKNQMGFGGFVVGDWNGHGQVPGCSVTSCVQSVNAGLDMFMAPDSWKGLYKSTLAQARSGQISRERLDEAVARILRVKFRAGLFDSVKPSERPYAGRFELLGAPDHRAVAREAVQKSLVLLKNEKSVLPLRTGQRILVAGDGADDMMKQSGGWTLTWQGTGLTRADFPGATTIWEGLRHAAAERGATATFDSGGDYREKPDVAVVVFGENPYAEFKGDVDDLAFRDEVDNLALMKRLRADGIPVVAIFLSGRPMWVNSHLNAADAFVAAWLPGSEGGGVADLLFGAKDFTGRLPFSWPALATQSPLNRGQDGYAPLFALGYGLSYAAPGSVGILPEVSGVSELSVRPGSTLMGRGEPGRGYALLLETGADAAGPLAVGSWPGLTAARVDRASQEDAWALTWTGKQPVRIAVRTENQLDWSRESNGDVALTIDWRIGSVPAGPVDLAMGCGPNCGANWNIASIVASAPRGEWTTMSFPLRCFDARGMDMTKVGTAFALRIGGAGAIDISNIRLGNAEGKTAACPG